MRIAIAAPAPRQKEGGVANVVYNTAEGLRRRGHEVTCVFREDVLEGPAIVPRFEAIQFAWCLAALLRKRRREFDVVKSPDLLIAENRGTVSVRGDREFHRQGAEERKDFAELGVHSVFTSAQIYRVDGDAGHCGLYLFKGQAVNAIGIAITK